jgi:RNA polymerase sigma-70 factor (ECF subfamily)
MSLPRLPLSPCESVSTFQLASELGTIRPSAEWWRRQKSSNQVVEDKAGPSQAEVHSIVSDAFRRLPEEQRSLLWLREVEGQSYAELAATLEVPVGTVRSRLFAAREALRKIWQSKR